MCLQWRLPCPALALAAHAAPPDHYPKAPAMTYEEFLDEITTLIAELYDLDDAAAIKLVVDAQDADYFVAHDDHVEMRTHEQAKKDAVALFEKQQNKTQTQRKQQQRVRESKKK